jgi:ABC-type uncharacterized transport system substrate-binding protein
MMKALIWILALVALSTAPLRSGGVVAVLSADSGPYQEALEGLKTVLGDVPSATLPQLPAMGGVKVVVTFGSEAALKKYPDSAALVAALLPDPSLELPHGGSVTRVGLPPSPAVLIAKIKAMNPKLATLAVFNPNGAYSGYLGELKAAAAAEGLGLSVKNVASVADLGTQLPGLKGSVQGLWVPPDPLFMNRSTFGILAAFCQGGGIAFFAPVVGLAKAGAFAGVAPSFKQVGRAAGLAAAQYNAGSPAGDWVYSDRVETMANATVAGALGLGTPKADSITQ